MNHSLQISKVTNPSLAAIMHDILLNAFRPFRKYYTNKAFERTVVSESIMKSRIMSNKFSVYAAYLSGNLVGTVTTTKTSNGDLYIMSMAVLQQYSGKGIGKALIKTAEAEAKEKNCGHIILETYKPLLQAVKLYENNGFRKTGKTKDYSGIEIFEMSKPLL